MNKLEKYFTNFVNIALIILIIPLVTVTWELIKSYGWNFDKMDLIILAIDSLIILAVWLMFKFNVKNKYKIIFLCLVGFILRFAWAFSIESKPISDIAVIWQTGSNILQGDMSNMHGTAYLARFTHFVMPAIYSAFLQKFFANPLSIAKLINCIFSTLNIVLIYFIIKELFNNKSKAIVGATITAIYPPLILYCATYFTEVLAIPLYLLSIYMFILYVKGKKSYWYLISCGVALCFGNLFRMLAPVVLVAYGLYIFVYGREWKRKLKNIFIILLAFWIPFVSIDTYLIKNDITEYHLWSGRDPLAASMLKGLNVYAKGRWNEEDSKIPAMYDYDTEKVSEASIEIIKERFKTIPINEWFNFFVEKYQGQWKYGDFLGASWSEAGVEPEEMVVSLNSNGRIAINIIYAILIWLTYIGLFNRKRLFENKEINLIYFIFCGFALILLLTESQERYSFIVCWLFIILGIMGIEFIQNSIKSLNDIENVKQD